MITASITKHIVYKLFIYYYLHLHDVIWSMILKISNIEVKQIPKYIEAAVETFLRLKLKFSFFKYGLHEAYRETNVLWEKISKCPKLYIL